MSEQQFAYGADGVTDENGETVACPAARCGYAPQDGELTEIAEQYDENVMLLTNTDEHEGVVSESVAAKAWNDAIDEVDSGPDIAWKDDDVVLTQARDVADQLGW
jgi:hypothetical protein